MCIYGYTNVSPATVNADVVLRVEESGTASTDSDYDIAYKLLSRHNI